MKMYDFLIVGAGLSGAVVAERLAAGLDKKILIIDQRDHIGGNCYDWRDNNGILVHKYGPHIFHTQNEEVWSYLSGFTQWTNYRHKVISYFRGKYYPFPINLETVNLFYGTSLRNRKEMEHFLLKRIGPVKKLNTFPDALVSKIGEELYEAFIKHYTRKQWGRPAEKLDKSILERLPIKYDKDPYYFPDRFQGMPKQGYTRMLERMLVNKNITVGLRTDYFKIKDKIKYGNMVFTGRIDQFFNYICGRLKYRGINFKFEVLNQDSFQPNSVVNYPEKGIPFLRRTEFKKFYNTKSDKTTLCAETFTANGSADYPLLDRKNLQILSRYLKKAKNLKNTAFLGRLGRFQYLNMDQAVKEALKLYKIY